MSVRDLVRHLAAVIVALGIFLSGAAPALAMPAGNGSSMPGMAMMMPDMAPGMVMDKTCMETGKTMPGKQAPCKSSDNSCTACISCAVNVALVQDLVQAPALFLRNSRLAVADVNPDGIVSPPALPPPIFRA